MKLFLIFLFIVISNPILSQNAPVLKELKNAPEEIENYNDVAFNEWLIDFKKKAHNKYDISEKTLNEVFKNIK